MFFLMRVAFWLTVALVLLPSGGSQSSAKGPHVGATDAAVAAGAALSDMSNFCDRQAEACEVGANAAAVIGQRAQAGAKMVYEFISEKAVSETGARNETGSISAQNGVKAIPASLPKHIIGQHTLSQADIGPAGRGPEPRKQAQPRKDGKNPA